MPLIIFTDKGLYCPQGNFYLDPWRPVQKAVISHAHSDHARWGSQCYLCHRFTEPILRHRLGMVNIQTCEWNEPVIMNGVKITLHPAGHIIGSSQIRIEYKNEVWVFSGDYKTENDKLSTPFEPVRCHTFITESTFGLPVYQWKPQNQIFSEMKKWVEANHNNGITSVLIAYSLGKAQRITLPLAETGIPLYAHNAVYTINELFIKNGHALPKLLNMDAAVNKQQLKGGIIIAPPGFESSARMKSLPEYAAAICSGWMQVRGNARRRSADAGFALSDHADWKGLLMAIDATQAETVYVTHGFQAVLTRYLNEKNTTSFEVKTSYGNEEESEEVTV